MKHRLSLAYVVVNRKLVSRIFVTLEIDLKEIADLQKYKGTDKFKQKKNQWYFKLWEQLKL